MKEKHTNITKEAPEGRILLAYIKGTASIEEKRIVDSWLEEDESHEKELLQLARIYYAQHTYDRILSRNSLSAYTQIQSRVKGKKRRLWLIRTATVAACIIGVIILSNVLVYMREEPPCPQSQMVTVQATAGMRTQFNLPDGTQAYLNSGSTLSYPVPFDAAERRILLNGEAYFKVTNNPEQPFIVNTVNNGMSVKVLGTEFNMDAYEEDEIISATLVKGKISVLLDKGNGSITEEILSPSEKAVYDKKGNRLSIKTVDATHDTAWMNGKVVFKDTPLPEVLRKLSHFYNVEFDIQDKVIETYLFTGIFDNRQLSQILNYLEISSGIKYTIIQNSKDDSEELNREKVVLYKKKR